MIDQQASSTVGPHMEEQIQAALDEVLMANPEMTFWEATTELVTKGEINFAATEDPNVHTFLYQLFQRAKIRANADRVNRDM